MSRYRPKSGSITSYLPIISRHKIGNNSPMAIFCDTEIAGRRLPRSPSTSPEACLHYFYNSLIFLLLTVLSHLTHHGSISSNPHAPSAPCNLKRLHASNHNTQCSSSPCTPTFPILLSSRLRLSPSHPVTDRPLRLPPRPLRSWWRRDVLLPEQWGLRQPERG